ncbi:MAG TPA: arginine deiminase-related protein [Alphaproteobacteria bacterium]|nr:arginine deiminase-related protein [Alphaproteobacteria bacterium]HNS43738.1 arginine deiminase-related protein [Alphaproteobacteria bacterium]
MKPEIRQSADHILMVEPVRFHCNVQTMPTNSYQHEDQGGVEDIQKHALAEFRALRDRIVEAGVMVTTVLGSPDSPDDIFPNWMSSHVMPDGTRKLIYYPMLALNRRIERRPHIKAMLERGYQDVLDLSAAEAENRALESTSVLWFDRLNRVAYMGLSARSDLELGREWCDRMGYKFVPFETRGHTGLPVYHTDVMMFIGTGFAAVCFDCILPEYRGVVRASLEATGRDIVEIEMDQLLEFCGNSLELHSSDGTKKLVMSGSAFRAYRDDQKDIFLRHVSEIIYADLPTIQQFGGGAARCTIMEMF